MPNYIVVYDKGRFNIKIKRDREFYPIDPIAVTEKDSAFIVKVSARKKQEALNKAIGFIGIIQQKEAEAERKLQEEKGSTTIQTPNVKTSGKDQITIVPEAFEKEEG